MIIGIDGNEANVTERLGVGEYAYQLLSQFSKFQISSFDIAQGKSFKFQIYLKNRALDHMPPESKNWKYIVCGPQKAWTQGALPFQLYFGHNRPNVFFTPTHYAPRWSPVPTVVLILDLAYIFYPELFRKHDLYKLEKWTRYSVKKASAVLTISDSSKNDIMKQYTIPGEKISIIYPGIKEESRIMNQELGKSKVKGQKSKVLKEKYNIDDDFILFVGTLQPRKNIERLIEAYSLIQKPKDQKIKPVLVIIGKKGWQYENILSAPERFGVSDSVKFLDFVSDEDLPAFYQQALFFVLPSLYEGFGLPVLEAMKFGCPVLTSNVSSLPEAGGDAALYCNPTDVEDIKKQMDKLLSDKELRSELVKKGYAQIKKFSWEKAAKETLDVLKKVAGENYAG